MPYIGEQLPADAQCWAESLSKATRETGVWKGARYE